MDSFAKLESDRFAMAVHRFNFATFDDAARRRILNARPDVAIVRVPANQLRSVARISGPGFRPVVADTLVYYARALPESYVPRPRRNEGLVCRAVAPADRSALERLIRRSFADYSNHYGVNPNFAPDLVREGFVEWGLGFLMPDPTARVFVAEEDGRVVGFAACRAGADELDVILNGVDPEAAGRGIYHDLLGHVLGTARGEFARVVISTQIDNTRVQRVWQRHGFLIDRAYNTFHLNLYLGTTGWDRVETSGPRDRDGLAAWLATHREVGPRAHVPDRGTATLRRRGDRAQLLIEEEGGGIAYLENSGDPL